MEGGRGDGSVFKIACHQKVEVASFEPWWSSLIPRLSSSFSSLAVYEKQSILQ